MRHAIDKKIDGILKEQLTKELIRDSYRGISFTPEKRAEQEREGFRGDILSAFDEISPLVTDENRERFESLFEKFIDGYTSRTLARLSALSRCYSVMITGAPNFNSSWHQKVTERERKKSEEATEYYRRMIDRIKKALRPPEKSTAEKLKEAEERHAVILKLNKIIRNKKMTEVEKIKAAQEVTQDIPILKEFGWNLAEGETFYTTNSNARIKRLREKLEREKKLSEMENKIHEYPGFSIVENYEEERFQIVFDSIPEPEIRQKLKSLGFRWSRRAGAWQVHLTSNGKSKVLAFVEYAKEKGL